MVNPLLQISSLHKSYSTESGPIPILRGVDLTIERLKSFAIIGPSGCGKSTLLHLIGGLDRPSSGKIEFEKGDITAWNDNQLADYRRDKIGFVFQSFHLFASLTVLENILIPGILRRDPLHQIRQRALDLLEKVHLLHRSDHPANQLSGGEMQRIALCRALMNRPVLLLADEPTGNLDQQNRLEVYQLLQSLAQEEKTTVLMVSHDDQVSRWVDHVFKMEDGKIILS